MPLLDDCKPPALHLTLLSTWCHGWGLAEHVLVRRGAALAALTSSTNSFPTALLREGKSGCEVQVTR